MIDTTLRTFAANFTTTLAQLRAAAGPGHDHHRHDLLQPAAQLPAVGAGPSGRQCAGGRPRLDGRLNDLIRHLGRQRRRGGRHLRQLAARDLVGGDDCLHPNDSGHQIIADLFDAALAGAEQQGVGPASSPSGHSERIANADQSNGVEVMVPAGLDGSFWLGTAGGAVLSVVLLNENLFPADLGRGSPATGLLHLRAGPE